MSNKCFHCGEEVAFKDTFYIPLEKPYINIPFDKSCYVVVINIGEAQYLEDNKEKVFHLADNPIPTKKEKKK